MASIRSGANFSEIRSVADAVLRELGVAEEIMPSQDRVLLPGRGQTDIRRMADWLLREGEENTEKGLSRSPSNTV